MPKRKLGIFKIGKKRVLSMILAMTMLLVSIPAWNLLNKATLVKALASYEPVKLGVSLMCADMLKSDYGDKVYKNIVRAKSQSEDRLHGSPFNNVGMFEFISDSTKEKLTYDNKHGGAGKAYYTDVKTDYNALYNLAKKGQIEQSICANGKNHKHTSRKHLNKIKQYNKIILGYPKDEKNDLFYCAHLFETNDKDDYSTVGGNDYWSKMKPDKGYKNREAVYLTAKKGCDKCSGAYVEKVSVALKDTVKPKIVSLTISSDPDKNTAANAVQYFNAGNTIYIRMQFSEYVRLADNLNTHASTQSTNLKLGLALSTNTLDAQIVYANLYSLKGDTAVFSYKIPSTVNNETTDYFVERIADISKQSALISKEKKFNRVFLDNKGNTLFDTSSDTLAALKSAVGEDVYKNELRKTTSAITDIAGNPLDINDFRDDTINEKLGPLMNRTYLDAANPVISKVSLSSKQSENQGNDNAQCFLQAGNILETSVVINEKLKKISDEELQKVSAILNIYVLGSTPSGVSITGDNGKNYVTVKATEMVVDEKNNITTIKFENVTIAENMHINAIDTGSLEKTEDYIMTIKDVNNIGLLKDYADNACLSDRDYRDETDPDYYLDNDAPTIKVDNERMAGSSTYYEMTSCGKEAKGEVYCIKLSTIDEDKRSGNSGKPYASGVMDGIGSVSIDFQCQEDLEFQYVLHNKAIADENLNKYFKKGKTVSDNILIPKSPLGEPYKPEEFKLPSLESNVYLYLKFNDEIDYSVVNNGIKVTMNATDLNGNTATREIDYFYSPKDKVPPKVTNTSKKMMKTGSGAVYQQVAVYFQDPKSLVERSDVRYTWVKEGETIPDAKDFTLVPEENVYNLISGMPDKYCYTFIDSPHVNLNETYKGSLYMYLKDKNGNETITSPLSVVDVDMTMPALQITVPDEGINKSSSLVVNGPYTTSDRNIGLFFAIEDPAAPGYYFMKKQKGTSGEIAYDETDLLDSEKYEYTSACTANLDEWKYVKIEQDESNASKYNISQARASISTSMYGKRFMAIASDNYYGKVHVIAGTGFIDDACVDWAATNCSFDASRGSLIEKSFVMISDSYALSDKLEINDYTTFYVKEDNPIGVTVTPQGDYGKQSDTSVDGYNPDDDGPEYLSSIGGAKFAIDISNAATDTYASKCIDFDSKDTYLQLKNVDTGNAVYEWDLAKVIASQKDSQESLPEFGIPKELEITIPEELVLENGHYAIEISIRNRMSDNVEDEKKTSKATFDDIYVYDYSGMMTEAFGIDSVKTKIEFSVADKYAEDTYPPFYGYKNNGNYDFSRTLVDERVKEYTSDSKEAYDRSTLYIGNFSSDSDSSSAAISYDKTIKMSVNGMKQEDLEHYWIKVWTGGAEGKQSAKWYKFTSFDEENKTMSILVKPVDALTEGGAATPELLLAEGSNTVSYQLMNMGGNKSQVHEIEIMHHKASPKLGIDVEKADKVVSSLDARVSQLDSDLIAKDVILYESDFAGNEAEAKTVTDREFTYTENGRHLFYAIDGYGNLAFKQLYITDIDSKAPTAEFDYVNPAKSYTDDVSGEEYVVKPDLKAVIWDDKSLENSTIVVTVDDREPYELTISQENIAYRGDEECYASIYRDQLMDTGMSNIDAHFLKEKDGSHKLEMTIYMEDDIDRQKAFKERIDHTVSINATDSTGKSLEKVLTTDGEEGGFYGLNDEIKLRKAMMQAEKSYMILQFNGDVKVTKVNGNVVPDKLKEDYSSEFMLTTKERYELESSPDVYVAIDVKDYFGICKDGTYEIEFEDVLGNQYVEQFEVKDFFGEYSADIQYSTVEKTNQNVVATITGTDDNAELSLADESAAESDKYTISWNKDKSKATLEFTENASVKFLLKVKGAVEEDKTAEYNVTVGNIDKAAPDDVQVTWVFKENGHIFTGKELDVQKLASLSTNDDIEVFISSPSEEIQGINDKGLHYVFSYSEDMERSYTFEYADECGNVGTPITVTLPDELVMTEYEEPQPEEGTTIIEDTEPPSLSADVYGIYDGMAEYKTSWNVDSETFEDVAEAVGFIAGYKIKYSLVDSSKAKIIVLDGLNAATDDLTYESSSQSIDGVKVSAGDNSLIITKECSITVVAIDSKGNKSSHSISATKFDTEKPTALVKKVGKSFTNMRLQFYVSDNTDPDNESGTVVPVTSDMKVGMDETGTYYYKDVSENGTYNIIFKDRCGNKSTITTEVTEIDNEAPQMKVLSWSPCYEKDGTLYEDLPPNKTVNNSVTLLLDFNKTVSKLQVFYKDGDDWTEDKGSFSTPTIDLGGRTGKIVFHESAPGMIKVVASSPNGKSSEISDINLIGKIDKAAPKITTSKTTENNTVKVVYKADEKVLVTGCDYDTTYGAGTNIPLTIKKNGTYDLTFTDMAGNITKESITVDSIDEIAPDVYVTGIPEEYVSPENCKIKVTMSEKGTITFQGKKYSVDAPTDKDGDGKFVGDELDWISLPINANGSYQVLAKDEAGLTSIKKLEIKKVDDTAPYIEFYKSSIKVAQGTTKDELKELLLDQSGYSLWDNVDDNPTITFEDMLTEDDLSNQGVHEVTYVLTDGVGNKRKATRYVKVVSSANLIVMADGKMMESCDSTIIEDNNVEITLKKSRRKGESFKIYYKKGIRKAGSLKNAKVCKNGKLTNLESGFYSLYIVTQNKETYLTYLYINK